MSNAVYKERRARLWRRGQARKQARREAQAERESHNRALRKAGDLTPWELAKELRAARRAKKQVKHVS